MTNAEELKHRDRAESDAELSLTQYAVDHCKTAIARISSSGKILYANEAERQMLGYSDEEVTDLNVSDVDPNWPAETWEEGWQHLKKAGIATFESQHRRKNGQIIPVEVTTNYIEHGEDEYLFAFVTDISERKQSAEALQESETKLRAIFDHHYQLTGLLDCQGKLLAANKTALEFAGIQESDAFGHNFWETSWWEPFQQTEIKQAIERAANGEFVRLECTHIRADGEVRDFDFSLSPVKDVTGEVIFLVPEGRDITELKRAEKRIHEHDAMIRDLVETSHEWIWAIDLKGIHTYCNPAIEEILGYQPEELVGESSLDLLHEEDRQLVESELPGWVAECRGWSGLVLRWKHKDGSWRYLESNSVPIIDSDGTLKGFRGVDRDITDRLDAEEKLAGMEARLAHVARLSALGEMMAGITHELVQPLHAITNFSCANANLLKADEPPKLSDLREWNEAIANSAKRAEEIIRRMRTFARRGENEKAPVPINDVIRESVQLVSFEARRCGAQVLWYLPESSPVANVDRVQIQQVMVNLLRNAFEAMADSGIEKAVVSIRVEPDEHTVLVTVADSGPGLSQSDYDDIFEPFSTTKQDGLGLGLAISNSIVEAHGGELWAVSGRTDGAEFRFTLPTTQTETRERK